MQKLKYIALGIIIGATVIATPSIASEIKEYMLYKADYKIIVNGQPYSNDELPILNYKGVTYTPLKAIGTLLNSDVQWNAEAGQVEIGKKVVQITEDQNPSPPTTTDSKMQSETDDNYMYHGAALKNTEEYMFDWDSNRQLCLYNISDKENAILKNIPYVLIKSRVHILKDFYNSTIYPIVK